MKPKKPIVIIGENEKEIIKSIGLGLLVVASFALPNLPMAIRPIMKMRGNKGFQDLLDRLKNKNIISLGGEEIKLTKKGKKLLEQIYISKITIPKPEEWDGNWHLVAYDIPEIYKKSRNLFREALESNNFYQIQKSLWVHPYECKEEIAAIANNINILPYVIVMTTEKLPNEKEMIAHFGLDDH